ncbi:MAG: hypothetical protein KQJ78_07455 [Deltaproteobacteria bacterium]|nr:hypothetical protein [Deltaproteobacteria bacterium]
MPVVDFDALRYATDGLSFAQARTSGDLPWFRGSPDGTRQGHVHNPLLTISLAHALLNTSGKTLGYPNDKSMAWFFQFSFVCMVLALAALGLTTRKPLVAWLAILLVLAVPDFWLIVRMHTRDAFRIIPLLLLTGIFLSLTARRTRRVRLVTCGGLTLMSGLSLVGHSLGGLLAAVIALLWFLWVVWEKPGWGGWLKVTAAVCLGVIICGYPIIKAKLETGYFEGNEAYFDNGQMNGTVLEQAIEAREMKRFEKNNAMFLNFFQRDHYHLSIIGCLAVLLALLLRKRLKRDYHFRGIPLLALMCVGTILPFTGALDFLGFEFSRRLGVNPRYVLHVYPFLATCLAALLVWFWSELAAGTLARGGERRLAQVVVLALVAALGLLSGYTVYQWPITKSPKYRLAMIKEHLTALETVQKELPPGSRLLLDDLRWNYYLPQRGVLLYATTSWELLRAQTSQDVARLLAAQRLGAVELRNDWIKEWWSVTPLYQYLKATSKTVKTDRFTIFVLSSG